MKLKYKKYNCYRRRENWCIYGGQRQEKSFKFSTAFSVKKTTEVM